MIFTFNKNIFGLFKHQVWFQTLHLFNDVDFWRNLMYHLYVIELMYIVFVPFIGQEHCHMFVFDSFITRWSVQSNNSLMYYRENSGTRNTQSNWTSTTITTIIITIWFHQRNVYTSFSIGYQGIYNRSQGTEFTTIYSFSRFTKSRRCCRPSISKM